MNRAIALLLYIGAGAAYASDGLSQGVIRLAANMNEIAIACNHMSISEVQQAKEKQKAAALSDIKISSVDYDKAYENSANEFKTKWYSMETKQQKSICEQLKKIPK